MTKLLTFYSESHTCLLRDFFMPSFYSYPDGIDTVVILRIDQSICPSATYKAPGWDTISRMKVQWIADQLDLAKDGDVLLAADCDLQWFGPLTPLLEERKDVDLLMQDDGPGGMCAGFVRMNVSPRTRAFYKQVCKYMDATHLDEQFAINGIFDTFSQVSHAAYDGNVVWSNRARWAKGDPAPAVPENILVHHGNWTTTVSDKVALLQTAKDIVASRAAGPVQTC